jgi:hypothetical protein
MLMTLLGTGLLLLLAITGALMQRSARDERAKGLRFWLRYTSIASMEASSCALVLSIAADWHPWARMAAAASVIVSFGYCGIVRLWMDMHPARRYPNWSPLWTRDGRRLWIPPEALAAAQLENGVDQHAQHH